MRRPAMTLALILVFLCSCGSYRPEEGSGNWSRIRWSRDYAAAQERALQENKPLLVILVSGDLEADC